MKTVCCSTQCKRQGECANHAINNEGMNYCEDFYNFGWASISDEEYKEGYTCSELGNWAMFEPIKKKTDYEQWKDWLDKWNVKYEEKSWNPNQKELVVDGYYSCAPVVFDLNNNFICMTSYE